MIFDALPFDQTLSDSDLKSKALKAFANSIEKNLDVKLIKDLQNISFGRIDLQEPLKLAALLKERGLITSVRRIEMLPDEPRIRTWAATCNDPTHHIAGGNAWGDDTYALYATLSEALERYIWMTQYDYLRKPRIATTKEIAKAGPYIAPEKFAGFSAEQIANHPERELREDARYIWIQGSSLVSGKYIYIPAQTAIGKIHPMQKELHEPVIRQRITNGLATWYTKAGAQLHGALEVIERDAYMIMWFNQMTLPRIALKPLCDRSPSLANAIAQCERYRLKTHVIQLPTDAPAHVVAAIVEDLSGHAPRFTIGLKAHTSLPAAIESAMAEALRARRAYRIWTAKGNSWDPKTPLEKIGHRERLYYWGLPEHAQHLAFLIKGPEIEAKAKPWDGNTIEQHLEKIVAWCKEKNLECISVPLTSSKKNPTSLHVEMVVMPQLQPTYIHEEMQHFGGTRLQEIPKLLGYVPRDTPFATRPHPFY